MMLGKWKKLAEAVQQNDSTKINKITDNFAVAGKDKYFDLCKEAVHSGAGNALQALLTAGGFNFTHTPSFSSTGAENDLIREKPINDTCASQLIRDARESFYAARTLPVLFKNRNNGNISPLYPKDFLDEKSPDSLLQACIEEGYFADTIKIAGLYSTPKLEFILSLASHDHYDCIADALALAAGRGAPGDADKAKLLLAALGDDNRGIEQALQNAALSSNREITTLLLPHASLKLYGAKLVAQMERENINPALIQLIDAATNEAVYGTAPNPSNEVKTTPSQETPAPAEQDERFTVLNDKLKEVEVLSDDEKITRLYHLDRARAEIFVTNKTTSTISPITIQKLDADEVEHLREIFNSKASQAPAQAAPAENDQPAHKSYLIKPPKA